MSTTKKIEEYYRLTEQHDHVRIPILTYEKITITDDKETLKMLLEELQCREKGIERPYNKDTWTMRNGEKILVKNMSNRHLLNCIKMMKRILQYEN